MATIRKRGQYQYFVEIRRKGYEPLRKTFDSKQDAKTWAAITESELDKGIYVSRTEAEQTTLGELLTRYEMEVTPDKKSWKAEKSALHILKQHSLAKRFVATIRSSDLASFRDEQKEAGYAAATIVRKLAILSHVFNTAIKEWGFESLINPVTRIKKPSIRNGRNRRVSNEEIETVIAATESMFLPPIIRFAVETAARRGEIAGLLWSNVDLMRRIVVFADTKNGDDRIVPLSTRALAVLQALPRNINGRVFDIRPDAISRAFERAVNRSGIENLCFHDLRHEATSRFFEKSLNVVEAATITGHKDLKMLKRYTHLNVELLAQKLG